MRTSVAAVALIRRECEGRTLWLAQWNPHWYHYRFVGGHRLAGESFRQCLVREVAEELGLCEGTDYAAIGPLAHLEYTAWSRSAKEETAYTIELFEVQLAGQAAGRKVDSKPSNRWLTEAEISNRRCEDGQKVSETMALLLRKAGLWPETAPGETGGSQEHPGT